MWLTFSMTTLLFSVSRKSFKATMTPQGITPRGSVSSMMSSLATSFHDIKLSHDNVDQLKIQQLIDLRTASRNNKNFEEADRIKEYLQQFNIELEDIPLKKGGGSTWVVKKIEADIENTLPGMPKSLMEYCHECYDLKNQKVVDDDDILKVCEWFLTTTNESTNEKKLLVRESMRGRKVSDAAFEFAMAAVKCDAVYELLVEAAIVELRRFGHRSSCRLVDILHMMEKLAVAGVLNQTFYSMAIDILLKKVKSQSVKASNPVRIDKLAYRDYSLLSDRPLLCLWRYASKQKKSGNQMKLQVKSDVGIDSDSVSSEDPYANLSLISIFQDSSLPLIVDLGCGFGVSNLGLASDKLTTSRFNYLGCDMSPRAIGYANGIATRWGISYHCHFILSDAESCVRWLLRENASVALISINFPTPYSLDILLRHFGMSDNSFLSLNNVSICSESYSCEGALTPPTVTEEPTNSSKGRNLQLPQDMGDFLVTPSILNDINIVLRRYTGYFFLQTNVEDVAVTLRKLVEQFPDSPFTIARSDEAAAALWLNSDKPTNELNPVGNSSVLDQDTEDDIDDSNAVNAEQQKRCVRWRAAGGEQARGEGYLSRSPLPKRGRTETEAACEFENKPVYRLLFRCDNKSNTTTSK